MQISDKAYISVNNNSITTNTPNVSGNSMTNMISERQIFHGKIIDIKGEQVSILLDNSKTLMAQMGEALNLNIGDALTFQVRENNGGNVIIRPHMQSLSEIKDSGILKVLDANNFSLTEKNYQIAETLMNNNMPVDKGSMQKIIQQTYKYPDASVDTIVNLNRLGIPVNDTTIKEYEAYITNTHQITNNLKELSQNIVDFSVDNFKNPGTSSEEILKFNTLVLDALSDSRDYIDVNMLFKEEPLNAPVGDLAEGVSQEIKPNINDLDKQLFSTGDVLEELEYSNNVAQLESNESSFEVGPNLYETLKNLGITDKLVTKLIDKADTPMKLLNGINDLLKELGVNEIDSELLKSMLTSDDYKSILKEAVRDKFFLDGNKMENPGEVDEYYSGVYEKANKLLMSFSGNGQSSGDKLSESASSLKERIDFMQNLNSMFTYAQLPVKMGQNDMNSELFVYLNKKKIKESKEEVSALLHLDMEHLGATDVHVSLRGTVVHTKFYVEDEASAKIIDEHMTMLEKAINDSGFSLTNQVITRKIEDQSESNMVVKEMLGTDLEKSVKRYSFDVRM